MADLTLRSVKGAPLTNGEVDGNFNALNADIDTRVQKGNSSHLAQITGNDPAAIMSQEAVTAAISNSRLTKYRGQLDFGAMTDADMNRIVAYMAALNPSYEVPSGVFCANYERQKIMVYNRATNSWSVAIQPIVYLGDYYEVTSLFGTIKGFVYNNQSGCVAIYRDANGFDLTPSKVPDIDGSNVVSGTIDSDRLPRATETIFGAVRASALPLRDRAVIYKSGGRVEVGVPVDDSDVVTFGMLKELIARQIKTTAPLYGGGDLSTDRNLTITKATASSDNADGTPGTVVYAKLTDKTSLDKAVVPAALKIEIDNATPAGHIDFFAMSTPPNGYLECNGGAISRTTYSALFSKIGTAYGSGDGSTTFNIPDGRGRVPRAWDHGKGIDPNRVFGSTQEDAIRNITGSFPSFEKGSTSYTGAFKKTGRWNSYIAGGSAESSGNEWGAFVTFDASTSVAVAAENRVRNIAYLQCIKY